MALLPDMSGVCRMLGTLEMTSKPDEGGEHEHHQEVEAAADHKAAASRSSLVGAWRMIPPAVMQVAATISSSKSG